MTTVIGVSGVHDSGKSTLLKEIAEKLKKEYQFEVAYHYDPTKWDYVEILKGKKHSGETVRVAICTGGDNAGAVSDNIRIVKENNGDILPDFFLSACRDRTKKSEGYELLVSESKREKCDWLPIRMTHLEPPSMNAYKEKVIVEQILC